MNLINRTRPLSVAILMLARGAGAQSQPAFTVRDRQESLEVRSSLVARVAYFRLNAMGDTAKFSFCEAAELVGDSETFGRFLRTHFPSIKLFFDPASACSTIQKRDHRNNRVARLDSIRSTDDSAAVFASVRQNEHVHREEFKLVRRKGGRGWDVIEMKVYGILRLH